MCKKKTTLLFPSLEKLKRLTPVISTATKLREIEVEEEWFNALEWDDQNDKLHLRERIKVIYKTSSRLGNREWLFPVTFYERIQVPTSGTIMTIYKDRVKPSPKPGSWSINEIFAIGIVIGTYLALVNV